MCTKNQGRSHHDLLNFRQRLANLGRSWWDRVGASHIGSADKAGARTPPESECCAASFGPDRYPVDRRAGRRRRPSSTSDRQPLELRPHLATLVEKYVRRLLPPSRHSDDSVPLVGPCRGQWHVGENIYRPFLFSRNWARVGRHRRIRAPLGPIPPNRASNLPGVDQATSTPPQEGGSASRVSS